MSILGMMGILTAGATGCGNVASANNHSSASAVATSSGKITNVTIAAQDFAEPLIDDYMIKDLIEAKTPIKVTVKQTSGASGLLHTMLKSGAIQMYLGYDGTEFSGPLQQAYAGQYKGHPDRVSNFVQKQELKQWDFWVSPSLGYEDTYALAVKADVAKKYHLKNIADAVTYSNQWTLGTDPTFQARQGDGLQDMEKTYGMTFKSTKAMSYDLMYPALANGAVQAIVSYSTDGRLKKLNEVPLTDNLHFFPPYHAIVLMNHQLEQQWNLNNVLKPLWGAISTADQIELNYEVDVLKKDPETVAHNFLVKKGLLQ